SSDPELVAHAVAIGSELGADLVKTVCTDSVTDMQDITAVSPIPVLVAGGPRMTEEDSVMRFVREALRGGASGVAMGRNLFQSEDPRRLAESIAEIVH